MKKYISIGISFLSLNLFAQNISKYFPDIDTSVCILDSSASRLVWVDSLVKYKECLKNSNTSWVYDEFGSYFTCGKKPLTKLSLSAKVRLKSRHIKKVEHEPYEYFLPLNAKISDLPKPNYIVYEYDVKINGDTLKSAQFSFAVKQDGTLDWIYELPLSGSFVFINPIDTVFNKYINEKDSICEKDLYKVLVNSSGMFNQKFSYDLRFPCDLFHYNGVSVQGQYFYVVYSKTDHNQRQKYWILEAETGRLIEKGFGDFWLEKKDKGLFLNAFIFHDTYHIK